MDNLRIFVAIPLPQSLLEQLDRVQLRLEGKVPHRSIRWVGSNGIHLTLKFLGDTPRDEIPTIREALTVVARHAPRCTLTAEGLGCFPSPRRPRVVWVGVSGANGCLKGLFKAVEEAMTSLGYPPERHGFTPHLTLGRVRRGASGSDQSQMSEAITGTRVGELTTFTAERFELIQSELKPSGAEYTTLHAFELLGGRD